MPACYAKGCRNSSSHGVKMNLFPRDTLRRALWVNQCKKYKAITFMLPNNYSALCEYHFPAEMWEKPRVDGKKKLKSTAFPTLFNDKVVQVVAKGKQNVRMKVYHENAVVIHNNPQTAGIQVLTVPGQQYQMVLVNGSTDEVKHSHLIANLSKDPLIKVLPSLQNMDTSLHSGSNAISSSGKQETSVDSTNSTNVNDHISNGNMQADDDSDTDSFIDKNFEPVSDDEIVAKEQDYENFEPITIEDSDEEKGSAKDEKNLKVHLIEDERDLYLSLRQLDKSASKTEIKCERCKRLEKICHKSERIRTMMKRSNKQTYMAQKRKIQSLESKIEILQNLSRHDGLRKILNEDQIDYLGRNSKKVHKWSEETLDRALEYKLAFGIKGYKLLLNYDWPLPSLRTLRAKEEEMREMAKRNVQTVISVDSEG